MALSEQDFQHYRDILFEKHGVLEDEMETIRNIDVFLTLENRLKIRRIVLRVCVPHKSGNEGTVLKQGSQPYTFYWVCLRGEPGVNEPFTVSFTPKVNYQIPERPNLLSQQYVRANHEIRREAYQDLKDCIDAGFKVEKNFVEHNPDKPLPPNSAQAINALIAKMKKELEDYPEASYLLKLSCERGFQERYEHYCEKYHVSSNPYYLQRAWFWKKLTFEEMSVEHRLLAAVVFNHWFDPKMIEYELRKAYGEWPLY